MADTASLHPLVTAAPNWINWVSFVGTMLGLVVSVVGLRATYVQARGAKRASEDASRSAHEAIAKMRHRSNVVNLSSIIPQLKLIREYIDRGELSQARNSFESCATTIREVFYNLNILSNEQNSTVNSELENVMKQLMSSFDQTILEASEKVNVVRWLRFIIEKVESEEIKRRWESQ